MRPFTDSWKKPITGSGSHGVFNHPDVCWRNITARNKQSRWILDSTDDNFLTQVVEGPVREGVLLDMTLTD